MELVLSDEDANDFESRGFKTINGTQLTKTGEQKTSKYYEDRAITIKRNVKRKDGTLNFVPKLYDTDGSGTIVSNEREPLHGFRRLNR